MTFGKLIVALGVVVLLTIIVFLALYPKYNTGPQKQAPVIYSGVATEIMVNPMPVLQSVTVIRVKREFPGAPIEWDDVLVVNIIARVPAVGDSVYFCMIPVVQNNMDLGGPNPIKIGIYIDPTLIEQAVAGGAVLANY